jgi:hypothetical protein
MARVTNISGTKIGEKRKRGAPPGNKNAVKHGFYSKALLEAERVTLQQAVEVEGVDEEIALLRYKLAELLQNYPDRIDLQVDIANTIARLVRTRYQISKEQKKSLKEAIARVLTEVAVPLGIGVGIKAASK